MRLREKQGRYHELLAAIEAFVAAAGLVYKVVTAASLEVAEIKAGSAASMAGEGRFPHLLFISL